ncbi:DUF4215 domain-containing protein [Nannocystis radixulma]|uniref:DUF4215 domain-containing protein n=1 Tax=Nannocystis radixulma TaxID=2995305 RepID=A0ABT5AY21_9BACT|nr:DUF4215 domain-containing protein [Nannocystis radixulma]MDC0666736.1 DUF4215 domain-containing protein [Nannocystis radixulma]
MLRTFLNTLKTHRNLFLAGALLGLTAAACDPKMIGDETKGDLTCQDGDTKDADDGCNTCTCHDGEWGCTLKACADDCEDGETKPDPDGCNTCTCHDGGWACTEKACPTTDGQGDECGDGVVQAPEECDDGNLVGGDGCSSECTLDGADTEGSTGDEPVGSTTGPVGDCGNGVLEPGEACDDGNLVDGDGCSSSCSIPGGGGVLQCAEPIPNDWYTILEAAIVVDTLAVQVQYGGGCETHEFSLCWDGAFAESDPVQIWTKISHDGNNDNCDAAPIEDLEFDLADLKATWQQAYQQQSGEITIHLDGWPSSLVYAF